MFTQLTDDGLLLFEQQDCLRGHFVDGRVHLLSVHGDHAGVFLVGLGNGHHHPGKMLDLLWIYQTNGNSGFEMQSMGTERYSRVLPPLNLP